MDTPIQHKSQPKRPSLFEQAASKNEAHVIAILLIVASMMLLYLVLVV